MHASCEPVLWDDGAPGEQYLRDFQDTEKTIPTILTTSQKLSTGVDARNIRNIVLMPDQFHDRVQADHQSRNPAMSAPALRRTAESAKRGAGITGLQEPGYSYSPAPPRSDFPVEPSLFLAVHEMSLL